MGTARSLRGVGMFAPRIRPQRRIGGERVRAPWIERDGPACPDARSAATHDTGNDRDAVADALLFARLSTS